MGLWTPGGGEGGRHTEAGLPQPALHRGRPRPSREVYWPSLDVDPVIAATKNGSA